MPSNAANATFTFQLSTALTINFTAGPLLTQHTHNSLFQESLPAVSTLQAHSHLCLALQQPIIRQPHNDYSKALHIVDTSWSKQMDEVSLARLTKATDGPRGHSLAPDIGINHDTSDTAARLQGSSSANGMESAVASQRGMAAAYFTSSDFDRHWVSVSNASSSPCGVHDFSDASASKDVSPGSIESPEDQLSAPLYSEDPFPMGSSTTQDEMDILSFLQDLSSSRRMESRRNRRHVPGSHSISLMSLFLTCPNPPHPVSDNSIEDSPPPNMTMADHNEHGDVGAMAPSVTA